MMERLPPSRRRTDDPRYPVRVPATIKEALGIGPPVRGQAADLSRGGLSVRLQSALAPGTPVCVTLHLHGRSALTCMGRVAWVDRPIPSDEWAAGVTFFAELNGDLVTEIAAEEFAQWEQRTDSSTNER
jgi:hypothetical protein